MLTMKRGCPKRTSLSGDMPTESAPSAAWAVPRHVRQQEREAEAAMAVSAVAVAAISIG
jgi:hypothetical protein